MPEISGLDISHLTSLIKICFFVSMLTAIIPIVNHHLLYPAWRRIREIPPADIKHLIF
jgi:hypothetical protein